MVAMVREATAAADKVGMGQWQWGRSGVGGRLEEWGIACLFVCFRQPWTVFFKRTNENREIFIPPYSLRSLRNMKGQIFNESAILVEYHNSVLYLSPSLILIH